MAAALAAANMAHPPPLAPLANLRPPTGETLLLLATLSNPAVTPHAQHAEALAHRDRALAASPESYGALCADFARTFATADPTTLPESETAKLAAQAAASPALEALKVDPGAWIALRQMAGLLLKNALGRPPWAAGAGAQTDGLGRPAGGYYRLPPAAAAEIRQILQGLLADPHSSQVRRVASTAVATAAVASEHRRMMGIEPSLPLGEWPELLPSLLRSVETGLAGAAAAAAGDAQAAAGTAAFAALDGSLLTLRKLLEDDPAGFERDSGPSFNGLVHHLLQCLSCPAASVRQEGLRCLHGLVGPWPGSLVVRMDEYLGGLSVLASDADPEVRRLVCQSIGTIMASRTEYLAPHIGPVAEFILKATEDPDDDVRLEACEFWLTLSSIAEIDDDNGEAHAFTPRMMEVGRNILPRLVPVLLRGMVYDEEKREELLEDNARDESDAADRDQDVAPVFHSSKAKGQGKGDGQGGEEEEEDDDDGEDGEWNVRKCSAASLDSLAGMYGPDHILPPLLPGLQEGLAHQDPWVREASVLALGAIADGCGGAMEEHMAELHPYLMAQLSDPATLPQLKSIAAWSLGRYAGWATDQVHSGQPDILGRMTEALMSRALDPNRRVQVAMCSSFGVLVETAGDLLVPYLEPVYGTLAKALETYHTRSLHTLLEVLGTMADYLGPVIGEGRLPGLFVPPLLGLWAGVTARNPADRTLLPLAECLASVALVLGSAYQPWALRTFDGAMAMIEHCVMTLSTAYGDGGDYADEEADAIVCGTDVLDGLAEGLGGSFPALVAGSARYGEHFLGMLHQLTAHDVPGVRMSAFALLGDLARLSPSVVEAGLDELLAEAVASMEPMHPSVCNNAVWAVGEICVQCGRGNAAPLRPHAPDLVRTLATLLMGECMGPDGSVVTLAGIAENSAATMGRLALCGPGLVAPDLAVFLTGWCDGMAKISDPGERSDAFGGLVQALRANPGAVAGADPEGRGDPAGAVRSILFAVSSWHLPQAPGAGENGGGGGGADGGGPSFVADPPGLEEGLRSELAALLSQMKAGLLGEEAWREKVERGMPPSVRRLFRDSYGV